MKTTSLRIGRPTRVALAGIVVAGCINLAVYQYVRTHPAGFNSSAPRSASELKPGTDLQPGTGFAANHIETKDGRHLLWAQGPKDPESGEWFDVTDSPLDPDSYGNGIGKDQIPAIDEPTFVTVQDKDKLREERINDDSLVIGYVHNGEAKAYPIEIMHYHELVNDVIGGKPVTVGW
jgi:hypothetical protein